MDIHHLIEQANFSYQKKFVCKMEIKIRNQNQQILEERTFIQAYIANRKSNKNVSKNDKIKMISLLIKYRLLKNKNSACDSYKDGNGACYFSSGRFDVPDEVSSRIADSALKYAADQIGEPKCLLKKMEYPLTSTECEQEILSRIQVIPAPLVLAQSALESSWGREEKWVSEYNNYFGLQFLFNKPETMSCYKNCRCVDKNPKKCALRFENDDGSIYEYYMRFNASPRDGYKEFRKERKVMNLQDDTNRNDIEFQCRNARMLTSYLKVYSENNSYGESICDLLKKNICKILNECPQYNR